MNRFVRFIIIQKILLKYGLERLVWCHPFFKPLGFLKLFFPHRWFKPQTFPTGQHVREALVELGPIFVKFGQLLSTRRDLLSDDFAFELSKLQDKVPPFDGQIARQLIEKRFGKSITEIFAVFEETPVASASIAQVHRAQLKSKEWVAIKVLRPKIHAQITMDVELLTFFAKLVHRAFPQLRRFRPCEIVKEFQQTLYNELDLLREAANATQLRRNFLNSSLIYIPEIYWDYCHQDVLVSQFIEGIPVSHIDSLKQANVNLKLLAERGVEIFFTQVFRDCFFHADMHAGNIFVDAREPDNPKYIAVDFGIMGSLNPTDQKYLATNFLAFFKRDYRKVAQLHIDSGWVPSHTRVDEFEASIRTVCEPMFEKPLKDISFGRSLLRLFQTARKFDMEIQPQLLLLQKTLLSVEGLGKQLYPELDLWHTAKPFLERWMKTHMGPKALIKHMREKLPFWFYKMPEIPEVMHNLAQHWHHEGLRKEKRPVPPKSVRNIILTTCSSILLLGGIFTLGYSHRDWILQYPTWVGGALCFLGLVLYVLPVRQ